jgi:chromosome partitioning protein
MAIFAVVNLKGGVGKSTLAMHIAGTFGMRGLKVLVIDADVQGTSTAWSASAPDDDPFMATVIGVSGAGEKLDRAIRHFAGDGKYDHIVVDCAPDRKSPIVNSVLSVADIAIIPVIPSPPDVIATGGVVSLIETAQGLNTKLRPYIVINQKAQNTTVAGTMVAMLEELEVPVLSQHIYLRTAYREAMAQGTIVQRMGSNADKAAAEINALVDEMLLLLEGAPA